LRATTMASTPLGSTHQLLPKIFRFILLLSFILFEVFSQTRNGAEELRVHVVYIREKCAMTISVEHIRKMKLPQIFISHPRTKTTTKYR
jgi:hypothetical protein